MLLNEIFFLYATSFQFQFHFHPLLPWGLLTVDEKIIIGHLIQLYCYLPTFLSVPLYIKCFIKQPGKKTMDISWGPVPTKYKCNTYPAPPKTSVAPDISRGKTVMTWLKKKYDNIIFFLQNHELITLLLNASINKFIYTESHIKNN